MLRNAASASFARASVAAVIGGATILLWSSALFSAEQTKSDTNKTQDDEELTEVQVTGTRIQVRGNYNSANPVTSISGEEMRQLGIVNVADALTQLVPQNLSTYTDIAVSDTRASLGAGTPDAADRGQYFIGNTIANLRGLDPAFGSRTLTLVDGRRTVSTSTQADVVDLNTIPSNLLERMDVVTGGASATYGSGAMAGVVNLVLNHRLSGVNLDMDYGVNEAGDGGSPHISLSGGTNLLEGRAHVLLGAEWQKTDAIQDCAAARSWCRESRTLFANGYSPFFAPSATLTGQVPGFDNGQYPAQFELDNVRFNQWSPNGAIIVNGQPGATSGWKFTDDGRDVVPYALGFRGGNSTGDVVNGDGPVTTSGTAMRAGNNRRTGFANLEYDVSSRTTAYLQANYAHTDGTNLNTYTTSNSCVRFQTPGVAQSTKVDAGLGQVLLLSDVNVQNQLASPSFRAYLGNIPAYNGGFNFVNPYWPDFAPGAPAIKPITGPPQADPNLAPPFTFGGHAKGHWRLGGGNNEYGGNWLWVLDSITITDSVGFHDPGSPAVLPTLGNDSYAFLNTLSPAAIEQLRQAAVFKSSAAATTTGNLSSAGQVVYNLTGTNPCDGFAAVKKVWSPQFRRSSENISETVGSTLGVRGRFGADWRWETYYQFGQTKNDSLQHNAATNIRQNFAMDAVTDTRQTVVVNGATMANPTYGKAVCRVTRDGVPTLGIDGRPLSNAGDYAALAQGCQPLDIFGSQFADADAAATQQEAIDYAFIENDSKGKTTQQTLSLNTNGTLWQGVGAGPLTAAFGLEGRDNKLDNSGSDGNVLERNDIQTGWSDKFGGRTSVAEAFTELSMPLFSGLDGLNLLSVDVAWRHSLNYNKGAAGTSGDSVTQQTDNWKFSTEFEPFEWVRFRLTRSRDMRAAGYRDLFIHQPTPGGADFFSGTNYWRDYSSDPASEARIDRFGTASVGNPNLTPEKSDTLTLGVVFSPGGWAQGMRMSVDYYDIRVKDGIYTSYSAQSPIQACWQQSGNTDPGRNAQGNPDPSQGEQNGLFDPSNPACQAITFATVVDNNGNPVEQFDASGRAIGARNLQDIVTYDYGAPTNGLPFQRRGLDISLNYNFPLNRVFETAPGSVALTVRGQEALEASGDAASYAPGSTATTHYNLVGQITSNVYIPGVSASPKWTGNFSAAYLVGGFSATLRANYIGGAKINNLYGDSPGDANYQNANGVFLQGSIDNNTAKPYMNFALSGTYDMKVANTKQFQIFGVVNNLFDKSPPYVGGYLSGTNPQYYDIMGRAYRMGVRLKF